MMADIISEYCFTPYPEDIELETGKIELARICPLVPNLRRLLIRFDPYYIAEWGLTPCENEENEVGKAASQLLSGVQSVFPGVDVQLGIVNMAGAVVRVINRPAASH
jgi:hypothetical protein